MGRASASMRISIVGLLLLACACSRSTYGVKADGGASKIAQSGRAGRGQSGATGSGGQVGRGVGGGGTDGGSVASGGRMGSGEGGGRGGNGGPNGGVNAAGNGSAGQAGAAGTGTGPCFHARRLWFDDFEAGDHSRWTSHTYCGGCPDGQHWDGNNCQGTALSTEQAHGATHAERSEITCAYTSNGNVHRGYGGLQFDGDQLVQAYTNKGAGIDAPHGLVVSWWVRLDSDTTFANGKWMSFFTAEGTCDWTDEVIGFGLEDSSGHIEGAHYQSGGGTRVDVAGSPALPRHKWVRLTVYINYHTGNMHIWQDGSVIEHVTFTRALKTICQWHFGLYASGDNDSIVLFEDDFSLWKLDEDWTDFTREPYFDRDVAACQ